MEKTTLKTDILIAQQNELSAEDQQLIQIAIEQTARAYAPYSHFSVGAALRLENGVVVRGCNQENAAFPTTICAERSALFAAGAAYPDQAVVTLAIAARNEQHELLSDPISPCGTCRQAIIETETRFHHPVRILLYGTKHIFVIDSIKALMPLSFTVF